MKRDYVRNVCIETELICVLENAILSEPGVPILNAPNISTPRWVTPSIAGGPRLSAEMYVTLHIYVYVFTICLHHFRWLAAGVLSHTSPVLMQSERARTHKLTHNGP